LFLNKCYERKLQQLTLSNSAIDLFRSILEDWNTGTQKAVYLQNRNQVMRKLIEQESILSQARKLFVVDVLKSDDYNALKREYQINSKCMKRELSDIDVKLLNIDEQSLLRSQSFAHIFKRFPNMDTADKKHLVSLIPPIHVDFETGDMCLEFH